MRRTIAATVAAGCREHGTFELRAARSAWNALGTDREWQLACPFRSPRDSFHFSRASMAAHGIGPSTTVHAQSWSRDPGFTWPYNAGLSDALRFTTSP